MNYRPDMGGRVLRFAVIIVAVGWAVVASGSDVDSALRRAKECLDAERWTEAAAAFADAAASTKDPATRSRYLSAAVKLADRGDDPSAGDEYAAGMTPPDTAIARRFMRRAAEVVAEDPSPAHRFYQSAATFAPPDDAVAIDAALGLAWTAPSAEAPARLLEFVDTHPEHSDADACRRRAATQLLERVAAAEPADLPLYRRTGRPVVDWIRAVERLDPPRRVEGIDRALRHAAFRDAAAKSAARGGRWDAVGQLPVDDVAPETRRLIAEALTRRGDSDAALKVWRRVVDEDGLHDATTRLRLAEAAVASGTIAEAGRRLDQADDEAAETGTDADRNLLRYLRARWCVRVARLPEARGHLESVIREPTTEPALAAAAQFMIGETFLMGRDFPAAVEAYRSVEPIDPGGPHVPAAIVQSAAAFEQMGRTREASICYGQLLTRFPDDVSVGLAAERMAALGAFPPGADPPSAVRTADRPDPPTRTLR